MHTPIPIVYFGTPAYAEPALRALVGDARFEIRLVVTQPDRPAGRGHRLLAPAVKVEADELGLPVYQPRSLRDEASRAPLVEADADVFVVTAFGLIFGRMTLSIPRRGCLNLHASILPAYRGAAPIPAAILRGDAETGVTLMEMEIGLDTGPTVEIARTPIEADDTTASLTERLGSMGGRLLVDALPRWMEGDLAANPQPEGASSVRMLTKADGGIDWDQSAEHIERQVRAMWPWPRTWTVLDGTVIQVHATTVGDRTSLRAGALAIEDGRVLVGTGSGTLQLTMVQPAGANRMSGAEAVAGRHLKPGAVLTSAPSPDAPLVRPA